MPALALTSRVCAKSQPSLALGVTNLSSIRTKFFEAKGQLCEQVRLGAERGGNAAEKDAGNTDFPGSCLAHVLLSLSVPGLEKQ